MLLGLFSNPFFDLLGKPSFWIGAVIVVLLGFLTFICIKYPKGGLPVLAVVVTLGLAVLDAFCIIQLNLYYNAEGGIHGVLTGIFDTNKVDIVDDLTFELKNIELTESSEGVYSASITTEKVLSLDTKQSLGIFINGMPCDTVSEVHSDFAYAEYPYTFHDDDKSVICTDTLILNIAFYENSTYLNITTKGGTLPVEECVKYWHHYFNKNGFIVKVAPFDDPSKNLGYTSGNLSNYAVINYYVNDKLYHADCVFKGETIDLIDLEDNKFLGWQTADGTLIYESMTLNKSVDLYAKLADETTTSYTIDFINRGKKTSCVFYEGQDFEVPETSDLTNLKFVGWSKSKSQRSFINVKTFVPTEDLTLYAVYTKDLSVNKTINYTLEQIQTENTFDLDDYVTLDGDLSKDYVGATIEFNITKNVSSGNSVTYTTYLQDYSVTTDNYSGLGEGTLKFNLTSGNVITMKPTITFVPAENAISYTLRIGKITVYTV